MTLKGKFETFNLSTIFQLITNDKKTGILRVARADNTVKVYFKNGMIVYATSTYDDNRLGNLLMTRGVITKKQLHDSLLLSKQKKHALGKILIETGLLKVDILKKFLYIQAENVIYDLFLWSTGDFEYQDVDLNLDNMIVRQINTMALMLEASRRMDEMSDLKRHIPSDHVTLNKTADHKNPALLELSETEKLLLSQIDKNTSIQQLILQSGCDEYTIYKTINSLLISGMVYKVESKTKEEWAQKALEQLKNIDSKTVRMELDKLGLQRSGAIRLALTRISRGAIDIKDLLTSVDEEAQKIDAAHDHDLLKTLKDNYQDTFVGSIAYLLWERVLQK